MQAQTSSHIRARHDQRPASCAAACVPCHLAPSHLRQGLHVSMFHDQQSQGAQLQGHPLRSQQVNILQSLWAMFLHDSVNGIQERVQLGPTSTSPIEFIAILAKFPGWDVPEGSHGFLVAKTQHQSSYRCLQGQVCHYGHIQA